MSVCMPRPASVRKMADLYDVRGQDLDPVALDGSPAQAFASHKARANGIARHFARTRPPLREMEGQAGEDNLVLLIAHFHAVADDPSFVSHDGEKRSETAAPAALRQLTQVSLDRPGEDGLGLVGTDGASTKRDYDMALKGLVTLAYRYRYLLDNGIQEGEPNGVDFILDQLVPVTPGVDDGRANISGGHDVQIEIVYQTAARLPTAETENHLLMIESSRYLFNQLRFDRTADIKFDNIKNGLRDWLLRYMHTIAKHDFLEFNSTPYQRLALHPLLNLYEFARDDEIRTAAQILLDYTMVKCALSSNRARRVSPFRRQQHRIRHQANERNDLYAESGDQVSAFFLAYSGLTCADPNGTPGRLPASNVFNQLLAGTAAYRPPPAAYILALDLDNSFSSAGRALNPSSGALDGPPITNASLHRFYHGTRPQLPFAEDFPEGGLEIYYHSPSFLLSAGGQFLNSGYGFDEVDVGKQAWEQTSRAQATTLIPTKADVLFHDLIRFEPYPDPQVDPYADDPHDPDCYHTAAVNIGVSRGLMAGANLRPAEKKTILEHSTRASPTLAATDTGLYMAWKHTSDGYINIARVQSTTLPSFGGTSAIDGVEGVEQRLTWGDTGNAPALAHHNGRLAMAWTGSGNKKLNVAYFDDKNRAFIDKVTFNDETSDHAPALTSHNGNLYLAWTGRGNDHPNIARVVGSQLQGKVVLQDEEVDGAPALASHDGRLFLAWRGNNDHLNLRMSRDDGATFPDKKTFEDSSDAGPALASHADSLFMAWRGSGNEQLNVAKANLIRGGFLGEGGLVEKVVLEEISELAPTLASYNGMLFLAWKGEGEDLLNLRVSRDGTFQAPADPWVFCDLSDRGFYVAAYRTPPSRPEDLDPAPDNLGFVYAVEKVDMDRLHMDYNQFRDLTRARNAHLPAKFNYGGFYEFHAPDDKNFSIWFQLTGQKYQARVVDLSEPLGDLSTLPLVSGPYMKAPGPGGHDGLIEIRHPGSELTPLVLNYRDADHPVRIGNKTSNPAPWIDRAIALFAIASRLRRATDMHAALADAALLYDQMLRLNTDRHGPLLAPSVIQGLRTIGVDFSVPEGELLQWLANPLFTPYPAISQRLLLLRRKLEDPVFLDVIIFNYEQTAGVTSPRTIGDVREDVLKASILKASNERYGRQVRDFEQLIVPPPRGPDFPLLQTNASLLSD
jgi:hypothetical protein